MIIDAHNHPDWHGHNLDKFLQNMADHNIDQTWLLSWECPPDEYDPEYNHTSLSDDSGPIPFSSVSSPSHVMGISTSAKASSHNSRTEWLSPVATT